MRLVVATVVGTVEVMVVAVIALHFRLVAVPTHGGLSGTAGESGERGSGV